MGQYRMRTGRMLLILVSLCCAGVLLWQGQKPATQVEDAFPMLGTEAVLTDYAELFQILQDNYPHFGTVDNLYDIDPQWVKQKYRDELEGQSRWSIDQVAQVFGRCIGDFKMTGHLSLLNVWGYGALYELAQQYAPHDEAWANTLAVLSSAPAAQTYAYLAPKTAQPQSATPKAHQDNLVLREVDAKTAYVEIRSFQTEHSVPDRERLLAFYAQMADKENLIIDVTNNSGGSYNYWIENIVAPNMTEPVVLHEYSLAKSAGVYNNLAQDGDYNRTSQTYQRVAALPNIGQAALAEFDLAFYNPLTIAPKTSEKAFSGKIYVLVGEQVYSASEGFAKFCKDTGFATLVGSATGGDGGDLGLREFLLPNTGLVVRFSTRYALNADGSSNTEFGTTPHIEAGEQSALEACMNYIQTQTP